MTSVISHLEIRTPSVEEIQARMAAQNQPDVELTREDPALNSTVTGTVEDDQPTNHAGAVNPGGTQTAAAVMDRDDPATWGKIQRNAPCPCGSGKKYKQCHGKFG